MSKNKDIFLWIAAGLLCTNIITGYLYLYEHHKYDKLQTEYIILEKAVADAQGNLKGLTILINIKIEYGDSEDWYNSTRIPINSNLLEATQFVVEVNYSQREYGAIVNSINKVGGDPNNFWAWKYYDNDNWQNGPIGADSWILHDGDIVSWVYTRF